MDTKQIEYFFEILKYGSFTAAASHLYTNQSTVSRKISELEGELGAELFKRNSRILELTEAGEIFREEAYDILKRVNLMHDKIANIGTGKTGELIIGIPFNVLGRQDIRIVRFLKNEYPNLRLSFISMNLEELNVAVERGNVDIAITFDHVTKTIPEWIVKKPFFADRLTFIISDEDELCGKESIAVEDLYSRPLVLMKSLKDHQPELINKMLIHTQNAKMQEPIYCNNHESMIMEVSLGKGIGVLPRLLAEKNPFCDIKIIKVDDIDDSMNYVVLYNSKKVKPGTESFIRRMTEILNS